jgi:hypothetical protein
MSWTFDGIDLTWLRQEQNGVSVAPTWRTPARLVKHPLAGLKSAVVAQIGYDPTEIAGPVWFASASLIAKNGLAGTLSDGVTSWAAVLSLDSYQLATGASDGYTGAATFTRAEVVA